MEEGKIVPPDLAGEKRVFVKKTDPFTLVVASPRLKTVIIVGEIIVLFIKGIDIVDELHVRRHGQQFLEQAGYIAAHAAFRAANLQ